MMDIREIALMPTALLPEDLDTNCTGYHESLLRSYHIVAKLKRLIELNTPREVLLEMLSLMEAEFPVYTHILDTKEKQQARLRDQMHEALGKGENAKAVKP